MVFNASPLVGSGRRATSPGRNESVSFERHDLKRENSTNTRLGLGSVQFVNATPSRRGEKDTTSVGLLGENSMLAKESLASCRWHATKIGVLLPLLLGQAIQVVCVEPNRRSAAAMPATVAVPTLDDRQWFNRQRHNQ